MARRPTAFRRPRAQVVLLPSVLQRRLLDDAVLTPGVQGPDRLRLTPVPLAPEVRLLLADDPMVLWARLEAEAGRRLPPPFWASAWTGGQALARYVLDNPGVVAGRRVLDLASGSGLVAVAVAACGAASITANDTDPYAIAAIRANARANRVDVTAVSADLLDGVTADVDVVLAGDALYSSAMAERVLPFLARMAERGAQVLVGDPGRGHAPHDWFEPVAVYHRPMMGMAEDAQMERTTVLLLRRDHRRTSHRGGPG